MRMLLRAGRLLGSLLSWAWLGWWFFFEFEFEFGGGGDHC
jgi:hypothetical protein